MGRIIAEKREIELLVVLGVLENLMSFRFLKFEIYCKFWEGRDWMLEGSSSWSSDCLGRCPTLDWWRGRLAIYRHALRACALRPPIRHALSRPARLWRPSGEACLLAAGRRGGKRTNNDLGNAYSIAIWWRIKTPRPLLRLEFESTVKFA